MSEQQQKQEQEQCKQQATPNTNIPQMPIDRNRNLSASAPPIPIPIPPPPSHAPQRMMVLNRLTPIHPGGRPQFIIPQHPHPAHSPHPGHPSSIPPPPPPPYHHHHHPHPHPFDGPPPHQLFNAQYASGLHIPVTPVRHIGVPPNVVLTPIHGPPPRPHNVRFINSSFNVPPVQTIYNNNNNNNHSDNALTNIRQKELLPINPNNHMYANSQPTHNNVPPHIRSTLNSMQNNNANNDGTNKGSNVGLAQMPAIQSANRPKQQPFGYSEFQGQMKRIQTWNKKKIKQEQQLKEIDEKSIGVPQLHNADNEQNITGRAHFIPSHNHNDGRMLHNEYSHIGYDPNQYDNDRKRKRPDELSDDYYSETDEEDYDMADLLGDTTTESEEDLHLDGYGGPPKKKKRKKSNNGRHRNRMSKTERKKQYLHYMKQFVGIENSLNALQAIEPMEDLKKSRKEYHGDSNLMVEKILHRREYENPDTGLPKYEYYVLYKYLSYLHCEWMSEDLLLEREKKGNQKIKRFIKQGNVNWCEGVELFDINFSTVDRILSARPGPGYNDGDTRFEYFVKFNGLNYSDCRWEFADDIDDDSKIISFQKRSLLNNNIWEPKIRPRANFYKPISEQMAVYKDNNKLHEWQVEGVNWLIFNWYNRRGGILADEMGLGKTVQVVATLEAICQIYCHGPFLVVAPLSTINHWKREIEGWTDLNAVIYQGNKEDRRICHFFEFRYFDNTGRRLIHNDIYKFDILITTYESVMLDDELQGIKWKVVVVDEAHRLKNNEAKLSKHLRKCKVEHSILLTGTPIQNNMRELWNLLNFVDANTFVSYKDFEYKYGDDKMKSDEQIHDLKSLIKPYFLRRLKEDVAKFIPEKKETIIEVELTRIQKQYYRALLEKNREFLYRGVSTRNAPKLMNIANDLRKICNHPYLISGAYQRITSGLKTMEEKINIMISSSGKFILLDKLLPKLRNNGNKVLIFSQWRITLDWIEEYIRRKMYPYERIDGNITGNSRQAAIDRFCAPNSEQDSFIFLLTTKAGGVGLNLTAADTVIINDSDWNPQNDIQAMARCHRIGQHKSVKVYRLITSRSYEKEMFIKASKKLGLGQAIMGGTMEGENKQNNSNTGLSQKEINELLKHGAYHVFQDDDKEADEFCAENIDEILAKRSKDIVFDSKSNGNASSSFSRATFISSDDAANISLDDKDFWEKILPKELNPSDMIQTLLDDDENQQLIDDNDKKTEFWTHLTRQVEEVRDLRERGMLATQIQTVIKLLTIVANKANIFSNEQRVKAQDWANYIENPRRYHRKKKSSTLNEDDLFLPSTHRHNRIAPIKQTVYKTRQFTPKEVESLSKLFFDIFSTTAANIFGIIHSDFRKKSDALSTIAIARSLREITGWINAFVLYLSTELHDQRDKNAFVDVKHVIKRLMPKDFNKNSVDSDGDDNLDDEDYSPTSKKRHGRRRRKPKKLPRNCQITDFPSLDEKWFTRMINKESTQWAKRMRLAVLLRQRLKSIRNINNIKIPQHIGGNKPTSWWDATDDKNLLIGATSHGVCNWDNIRKDASLGFMKKINNLNNSGNSNNNNNHKKTASYSNNEAQRKCCGTNKPSEMDVQCDGCEDFLHGKCCAMSSSDDIPAIWFCFECNGSWPKPNVFYDRLAAILHAMKKTRYHGTATSNNSTGNSVKEESVATKSSKRYSSRESKKAKLTNSRTRIGRMWNFSLKEMHALQRTVQIYGKIAWYELKTKSKSPKTAEQVESYFYSFMSNVEYLIRCERLKELIVCGRIELPVELQEKFCRPTELAKINARRARSASQTPSANMDNMPPSLSPSMSMMEQPQIALPDLIKGACLSMVTDILNDNIISSHFASFNNKNEGSSLSALTLNDIYSKIELDQYYEPKQIFNHIQCMIDDKLSKKYNSQNEEILLCVNKMNHLIQKHKQHILINFANQRARKYNNNNMHSHSHSNSSSVSATAITSSSALGHLSLSKASSPTSRDMNESMATLSMPPPPPPSHNYLPHYHYVNHNRYKIKKTDMDMLSESDVEKYFGLKKPDSIVNHQLTVNLANKVWQRAQMWVHLRKVEDIGDSTLGKLYGIVKAQRNEPGTNSKLPEWWHPPKHGRLVIQLILKHGMQQTPDIVLQDELFKKEIDVKEHSDFLERFFVPKKPLILRLRYVAYVLTHGGEEPTRDTWHYNALAEIQGEFYYKPIQTREDYQRDMNEWFERNEMNAGDSQSPTPCSSIDLGLLSSKSPRRTGKSSELIERYRTLSRDEDGDLIFPIQAKQGASIISLGQVVYDRKLFSSSKYIWPNGFESQRIHPSYLEPSQRVIYTSKIIDAGDRPKFAVIASDDPDNPIIANSASTAWTNVITKVNYAKDPDKRRKTCTVSGPEMFGYNDPLIIALIEELTNAEKVIPYWKNRTPFREVLQDAFNQD